jgi:hypothetical protein
MGFDSSINRSYLLFTHSFSHIHIKNEGAPVSPLSKDVPWPPCRQFLRRSALFSFGSRTEDKLSSSLASLGIVGQSPPAVQLASRVYLDDEKLRFPDLDIALTLVRPGPITP